MSRRPALFAEPSVQGPSGFLLLRGKFSRSEQENLLGSVLRQTQAAPFFRGRMPRTGAPLSVEMTNLGPLGWVSAVSGYSYEPLHPETDAPWGEIPQGLHDLWSELADWPAQPEACLVNWYKLGCKLGLHVDADEDAKFAPVVSVSLGDDCLFRLGGPSRKDPTRSYRLQSGDVVVLGGASRRFYHGVDRIYAGTSDLVSEGGRINLTLRRVTAL